MKIGLSLSRCVRDIFEKKVDQDDVLVIIARTDFDPHVEAHWRGIWEGYLYGGMSYPEWAGLEDREQDMRKLVTALYDNGKIHQPRRFGAHPQRMAYYWLECVVPQDEMNPAQQKAWDNYKLITDLA